MTQRDDALPLGASQLIQDFFDKYSRSKQYQTTFDYLRKQADVESIERVRAAAGEAVFARLDGIKKSLAMQSQAIRNIDKLPNTVMNPEQKRQVIDGIYFGMMRIAQLGNTMFRQIEKNK